MWLTYAFPVTSYDNLANGLHLAVGVHADRIELPAGEPNALVKFICRLSCSPHEADTWQVMSVTVLTPEMRVSTSGSIQVRIGPGPNLPSGWAPSLMQPVGAEIRSPESGTYTVQFQCEGQPSYDVPIIVTTT